MLGLGLAAMPKRCYGPRVSLGHVEVRVTPPDPDDDVRLMRALARGDRAALEPLYDRYAPLLLALAHKVLGPRRETEDLVHDVFLEAWRCARDFDPERGSVRAWLVTRLRSRALDRLRSAGRAKVVLSDESMPEAVSADDPSQGTDRDKVHRALAQLSPEHRQVLELAYFDGLTSSEIAAQTNLPIGTVKSRVARGLAHLRALLGAGGGHA